VDHRRIDLELDDDAGFRSAVSQANGIIEDHLAVAALDQQWRQPLEIAVERRRQGIERIA